MMTLLESIYTSCSCNGFPHVLETIESTLIFGAGNAVVIHDLSTKNPLILMHHSDAVTSIRCLYTDKVFPFLTTSIDKKAVLWFDKDKFVDLEGHQQAVRVGHAIANHEKNDSNDDDNENNVGFAVATSGMDGVIVWALNENLVVKENIRLDTRQKLAMDLRLVRMQKLILIAALDDCSIHLYVDNRPLLSLKGHVDWVQSLDVCNEGTSHDCLMLASGGQDCHIRVWQLKQLDEIKGKKKNNNNDENEDINNEEVLTVRQQFLGDFATCNLCAVLSGHTDKVMSIRLLENGKRIISCSMDKSVIVWAKKGSNEFEQVARMGEVGGNTMGFLNVALLQSNTIIAASFHGGFHAWQQGEKEGFETISKGIGGHFGPVTDLSWHHSGMFLVSTSQDQTTRIHAPFDDIWHELARPQVHGHDLFTVTMLGNTLISGAEEKVVRVFEPTSAFVHKINKLYRGENPIKVDQKSVRAASVPSLGLSNKAINDENDENNENDNNDHNEGKEKMAKIGIPNEETLLERTLWPEQHKLYGHGNELFCVAASNTNPKSATNLALLASSCKASKPEQATIILWDSSKSYCIHQKLSGHNLTVTRLKFSPSNQFLLSVSRDRTWCLFELNSNNTNEFDCSDKYELVAKSGDLKPNGHQRIIWDCDWSSDGRHFVTCSRDKKLSMWQVKDRNTSPRVSFEGGLMLEDSVTSVAIFPAMAEHNMESNVEFLAAGLDNGKVVILKWSSSLFTILSIEQVHHKCVRRVAFRPGTNWQLATCSDDKMVRIHNVLIKDE